MHIISKYFKPASCAYRYCDLDAYIPHASDNIGDHCRRGEIGCKFDRGRSGRRVGFSHQQCLNFAIWSTGVIKNFNVAMIQHGYFVGCHDTIDCACGSSGLKIESHHLSKYLRNLSYHTILQKCEDYVWRNALQFSIF